MYHEIVVFVASYLLFMMLGVITLFGLTLPRRSWLRHIVAGLLAGVLALVLAKLASHLYYDPRPFVRLHRIPLIPHSADNGFPSDHMLLASVLASLAWMMNQKLSIILWVGALLIGAARVIALVHSPIDILASAIIGFWSVQLVQFALDAFTAHRSKKRML